MTDLLLGVLIAVAVLFWQRMTDERTLLASVVMAAERRIPSDVRPEVRDESRALAILHTVHRMTSERRELFEGISGPSPHLLWDARAHLNNPAGACGSCTAALGHTLVFAGYPVRKVGLQSSGTKAIHHVLETKVGGRWVLMDALYDLAFQRPDGSLASAREVAADWESYRKQTPGDYPAEYGYRGFYYTNWSRIPGMDSLLGFWPGLHTWLYDHAISLRFLFLDINGWVFGLSVTAAAVVLGLRLHPLLRRVREQMPARTPGAVTPEHEPSEPTGSDAFAPSWEAPLAP